VLQQDVETFDSGPDQYHYINLFMYAGTVHHTLYQYHYINLFMYAEGAITKLIDIPSKVRMLLQ
jgi:hypothetical protein